MSRIAMVTGITALLLLSTVACRPTQPESSGQAESASAASIARVVFVDKEECCDCTQNRIDGTWQSLTTAIEGADIEVERLHNDTQEAAVAPYQEMRPIMVIPAIYFFDGDGNLVEQLQGELTVDQIRGVIPE